MGTRELTHGLVIGRLDRLAKQKPREFIVIYCKEKKSREPGYDPFFTAFPGQFDEIEGKSNAHDS